MDGSLVKYINQIKGMPRLTPEKEKRLLKQRKEERDEDDVIKIANNYLMLVVKIALGYSRRYPDIILSASDLIGEGYKGLIRAAQKFDCKKGTKFSTYAFYWIRQAIIFALYNHSKTIKIYYLVIWQVNRSCRIRDEAAQLGKEISLEEIAEKIEVSAEKLRKNIKLVYEARQAVSMESPLRNTENEGGAGVIGDFIPDKKIPDPEKMLQSQQIKEKTRKMLLTITPREEKVLRMRFGIGEKRDYTLGEIGCLFRMSRERIRQIERKALRKLRKKFTIKGNSNSFDPKNYL